MLELWVLRLVDKDNPDINSSVEQISLGPEFKWFITEEFRRLRNDVSQKIDNDMKEKIPLSNENFIVTDSPSPLPDKEAAFEKIYGELEDEQKRLSNCMEVDKSTVGGQELKQRLVSSGLFYTSDAAMMIEEMVSRGELKMVSYDTYVRGSTKKEDDSTERKNPP